MGTDTPHLRTEAPGVHEVSRDDSVARPFFIVGFQRSGTTLLRMMIDSHPEVAIPLDTTGLWARYEQRLDEFGVLSEVESLRRLVESILSEERIRLWETPLTVDDVICASRLPGYPGVIEGFHLAYAQAKGKSRWGDKDPGNMGRLGSVLRWFPDARIVHIVRDGRDACMSLLKQEFGGYDLLQCAESWREQVWWVRQIGRILGESQYFELRYEDLVAEPERSLRPLAEFLGIDWSPDMLEYHRRVDEAVPGEKRHIWPLLDQPPQESARYRWKRDMSPGARICFEKRAGSVLREFGYETLPGAVSGAYLSELGFSLMRIRDAVGRRLRRG